MPQPNRTWNLRRFLPRISVHMCLVWCSLASQHLWTNLTFNQNRKWRKVWISLINPLNRTRSKIAAQQVVLHQVSTLFQIYIFHLSLKAAHCNRLCKLHMSNDRFFFLTKFQKSVAIHRAMKVKRPPLNAFLWTDWTRRGGVASAGSGPNSLQNKSRNSRRSSANTNIWTLGRELKLPWS